MNLNHFSFFGFDEHLSREKRLAYDAEAQPVEPENKEEKADTDTEEQKLVESLNDIKDSASGEKLKSFVENSAKRGEQKLRGRINLIKGMIEGMIKEAGSSESIDMDAIETDALLRILESSLDLSFAEIQDQSKDVGRWNLNKSATMTVDQVRDFSNSNLMVADMVQLIGTRNALWNYMKTLPRTKEARADCKAVLAKLNEAIVARKDVPDDMKIIQEFAEAKFARDVIRDRFVIEADRKQQAMRKELAARRERSQDMVRLWESLGRPPAGHPALARRRAQNALKDEGFRIGRRPTFSAEMAMGQMADQLSVYHDATDPDAELIWNARYAGRDPDEVVAQRDEEVRKIKEGVAQNERDMKRIREGGEDLREEMEKKTADEMIDMGDDQFGQGRYQEALRSYLSAASYEKAPDKEKQNATAIVREAIARFASAKNDIDQYHLVEHLLRFAENEDVRSTQSFDSLLSEIYGDARAARTEHAQALKKTITKNPNDANLRLLANRLGIDTSDIEPLPENKVPEPIDNLEGTDVPSIDDTVEEAKPEPKEVEKKEVDEALDPKKKDYWDIQKDVKESKGTPKSNAEKAIENEREAAVLIREALAIAMSDDATQGDYEAAYGKLDQAFSVDTDTHWGSAAILLDEYSDDQIWKARRKLDALSTELGDEENGEIDKLSKAITRFHLDADNVNGQKKDRLLTLINGEPKTKNPDHNEDSNSSEIEDLIREAEELNNDDTDETIDDILKEAQE